MSEMYRRGPAVEPREIVREGATGLRIGWADGRVCRYGAAALRRVCPCAQCVNEYTGERMLEPSSIADDTSVAGMHLVGRVRDTPELLATPIIVTTGYGTGSATLTLSQGADAYEPKPVDPASLLENVERLLSAEQL